MVWPQSSLLVGKGLFHFEVVDLTPLDVTEVAGLTEDWACQGAS
jgi:hypothetical protein